jgi:hypothetical protein
MDVLGNASSAVGGSIDFLGLLFIVGSLAMLWAIWRVMKDDLDLTPESDDSALEPHDGAARGAGAGDTAGGPRRPRRAA